MLKHHHHHHKDTISTFATNQPTNVWKCSLAKHNSQVFTGQWVVSLMLRVTWLLHRNCVLFSGILQRRFFFSKQHFHGSYGPSRSHRFSTNASWKKFSRKHWRNGFGIFLVWFQHSAAQSDWRSTNALSLSAEHKSNLQQRNGCRTKPPAMHKGICCPRAAATCDTLSKWTIYSP